MRQKSGPEKQRRKTRSGTFGARHVDTFQLKRKSASSWKGCGGGEHSRALSPRGHRLIDVLWLVEGVP